MKKVEYNCSELLSLTDHELIQTNGGGFISYLSFAPISKAFELVVTEVADLVDGAIDGYNYVRN